MRRLRNKLTGEIIGWNKTLAQQVEYEEVPFEAPVQKQEKQPVQKAKRRGRSKKEPVDLTPPDDIEFNPDELL